MPAHRKPASPARNTAPHWALRPVSLAVCLLGVAPAGFGAPQGAVPTFGTATVRQTTPGLTEIVQTTPRAGLDWTSFSIAAGERVNVLQPDARSVLLNRVVGENPSLIYGALSSNGSVWLINPRGIVFGAGSRIDVGSLVASTLSITQEDLVSGRLQLGAGAGTPGALRSEGQITATDGSVILVSPQLLHSGQIQARRVGLAAASEVLVDVEGDGLIFFNVRNDRLDSRLALLGGVRADGGTAEIRAAARAGFADTVLNLEGVVQARSLGQRNGRIVVDGGSSGVTMVSGQLDASGTAAGERGGSITVLGQNVGLAAGAVLDASGTVGGGSLRVGGDFQGGNPELHNAERVSIVTGARLAADALVQGDGGRIIVWSDQVTRYGGALSARGGAAGGNGGFAEVSGKATLQFAGAVDLSAPWGLAGTLLLDPDTITINNAGTAVSAPATVNFADAPDDTEFTKSSINALLGGGTNVSLAAKNLITIANQGGGLAGSGKLTLRSGGDIVIDAAIAATGGIELSANDNGAGTASGTGHVELNNANLSAGSNALIISNNGSGTAHSLNGNLGGSTLTITGAVALDGNSTWTVTGASTVSGALRGSSNLTKAGAGSLRLADASTYTGALTVSGGLLTLSSGIGSAAATVQNGATLAFDGAADITLDTSTLTLGGAGTLRQAGSQALIIDGATGSIGTGRVEVTGGSLVLAAGNVNRIANTTDVALTGGRLTASNASEEVRDLTLSGGSVEGVSALTVRALASTGASSVASAVTATSASVNGGTLTLGAGGASGSLGVASVAVADGATLAVNRIDNLTLPTLTGTGGLRVLGGDVTLAGNATALKLVRVDSGSLSLADGAARLGAAAAVTVGSGATLTLGDTDESVASLLLQGTLAGAARLVAPGYTLDGGQLDARLGGGILTSTNASTLNAAVAAGTVTVSDGTLAVSANNLLAASATVNVASGAELALGAGTSNNIATLALQGTVSGATLNTTTLNSNGNGALITASVNATNANVQTGVLTVGDSATAGSLAGGITVSGGAELAFKRSDDIDIGTLLGAGTLRQAGSGRLTLTGSANALATVNVDSGEFRLADNLGTRIGNTTAVNVAGGATFTLGNTAEQVGTLTLAGTLRGAAALSAGTYTLQNGGAVNAPLSGGALVVAAAATATVNSTANVASVLVNSDATLQLGGSANLGDASTVSVLGRGTLTLGADDTVGQLTLAGTLNGAFTLTATSGSIFNDGALLALGSTLAGGGAATLTTNGSVTLDGRSELAQVQINAGSTLNLGATADRLVDTGAVNISNGGTLRLAVDETIGALTGPGAVTGSGTLTTASVVLNNSSIGTPLITSSLTSDGSSFIGATLQVNGNAEVRTGTLTVGNGAAAGALTVTGTTTVAGGATLAYDRNDLVLLGGTYAGAGTLRQDGSGELQLSGTLPTLALSATRGTLSLAAGNGDRVGDNATVTIASGATLRIDSASETIGRLVLGGTLDGTGVLTAANHVLSAGAAVNAAVAGGDMDVDGAASLSSTATLTRLRINATGALTLANSADLGAATQLSISNGGTLTLGRNDTVASLVSGGRLAGSGFTLTSTGALDLQAGARIEGNLAGNTLGVAGNARLEGTASVGTVDITGGTLTLATPGRLLGAPALSLAALTGLALGGDETVSSFVSAGTLSAPAGGSLTASSARLQAGAQLNAALTSPTLDVDGNATLNNSVSATTVRINAGTLSTGGAQLLAATADVDVAAPATLALGGDQTVGTLTLDGRLDGAGRTLSAGTTTLQGADSRVLAHLGGGALVVSGNATLGGSAASSTLAVNGGATLTLAGSGRFSAAPLATVNGSLVLGGDETLGSLTGSGSVNLGTATLITGGALSSVFDGSLSGSGGLTKTGLATSFTLTGVQAYTGTTTISQGTLQLGSDERLANASTVAVGGSGVLRLAGTETVGALTLQGTLSGSGTLVAPSYTLAGGNTTATAALGAGDLVSTGTSTLTGTLAGNLRVDSGQLTLVGGSRLVGAATMLVVRDIGTLILGGAETVQTATLAGTLSGSRLTAGATTLQTGAQINADLAASTLTVAGDSTLAGKAFVDTLAVDDGRLTLGAAADRIVDTADVTVAGNGELALAGNETVATLRLAGTLSGAARLTADTTLQTGARVFANLGGATLRVTGDSTLTGSAEATLVNIDSGVLTLASANRLPATARVDVAELGTLRMSNGQSLLTLNLSGALTGTGTLVATNAVALTGGSIAASLQAPGLVATGTARLSGTLNAPALQVDSGSFTVTATGMLSGAPTATLTAPGTLVLQSAQTLGNLVGGGGVNLDGGTLTLETAGPASYSGTLSGNGGLTKLGNGNFTLGGAQLYGGATLVGGGTLTLAGENVLPNGSDITVAAPATLVLAGADTVRTLNLLGTVAGSGTLTAGSYTLTGGTVAVTAALGGGTLSSSGNSTLAGTSGATSVTVTGGLLLLPTADRLDAGAALTVSAGGVQLGGAQTVRTLDLSGTLSGAGQTLTASEGSTLRAGADVSANLGGALLTVRGNARLAGTAAATTVDIDSGTLTLAGAARLAGTATVGVASGAALLLGGDQTLTRLTLAGTLDTAPVGGAHVLTAANVTLRNGAQVNAALGAGQLDADAGAGGVATLAATAGGGIVNVESGQLVLARGDLLDDTADVSVKAGAVLTLNGSDRVGRLAVTGGTVNGTGTLDAGSYVISEGNYELPMGTGSIVSRGNTLLSGTSGATQVTVETGVLTLGSGGRFTAAPAVEVVGLAALNMGGDETFGLLQGAGTVGLGASTLTTGGGGNSSFSGALTGGGGVVKVGASTFTLAGNSTYTGSTRVEGGVLALSGTLQSAVLQVNAGTLALSGANRLVDGAAVTVINGASFTLDSAETIGSLDLTGTLGGAGILTAADYRLLDGIVNARLGAGRLATRGASTLAGTAAVGTLNVDDGSLLLAGAGRLTAAPAATVAAGASLRLGGDTTLGALAGAGSVALDTHTLTTGNAGNSRYDGVISGDGNLVKAGSGRLTLGGSNTYAGSTTVNAGTLETAGDDVLPAATVLTVARDATLQLGGAQAAVSLGLLGTLAGSGALTAAQYNLDGGTVDAALGAGQLVSVGASRVAATVAARSVSVDAGTLTLGAANLLDNAADVNVAREATLALGGNDTVATLALAGTLSGNGILTAATYALDGGRVAAALGAGELTSIGASRIEAAVGALRINVDASTLTLTAANLLADGATVNVLRDATLALGGADTISRLQLAGTLSGNAVLTAANYDFDGGSLLANLGRGAFASQGASTLTGSANVDSVSVTAGTLTLNGAARLTGLPVTTVSGGAALVLGGDQTLGSLAGAGDVGLASHVLTTGAAGDSRYDGVLSGTGGLNKAGSSVFTLGGASTYAGPTTVLAGTLATSAANRLPDASAVTVRRDATLSLGGHDTVATLNLLGTLGGNATLSAGSYLLDGGTANASLGSGNLVSRGASQLAGTAGSLNVSVETGELRLAAAERRADAATVTIADGATLRLNGDERVGRIHIAGTLTGGGVLLAQTYALAGGTVLADLGAGALSSSGSSLLAGHSGAGQVAVTGGTLTLQGAQRLTQAPAVDLAANTRLILGGDEALGALSGTGALDLGSHTLRIVSTVDSLFGGTLLGSGGFVKQGASNFTLAGSGDYAGSTRVEAGTLTLFGTLASPTLQVVGGTLALAAPDRLLDAALLDVARNAGVKLTGAETIGRLQLAGSLAGSGTLTATTYALDGGSVDATLGTGQLTSQGASRLGGQAAVGSVDVGSGTLLLASANRLTATPAVTVAGGAQLQLGGDQTLGTLAGLGSVDLGSHQLATGSGGDSNFGGTLYGAGGLVKQGASTFTLQGASTYTGATRVDGGTLALAAAQRLAAGTAVSVARGATLALAGDQTIGSLAVAGTLAGNGTLTAASYALDGGTVNAALGTGTLSSRGLSLLAATAAVGTLTVEDGTLTLAAADRLSAAPATTVAAGATLSLGGDQTLGTLAGGGAVALDLHTLSTGNASDSRFDGVIRGDGALIKQGTGRFTLGGANTQQGATRVLAGTLEVAGTLASQTVAVEGGTLALLAAERLADGSSLSVARDARLTLTGTETVVSLSLAGTLGGNGTLVAAQYMLDGGTVDAALGAGSLTSRGASRLNGAAAAGTLTIEDGTLSLGAADRLADAAAVTIDRGATLALQGNDTVASLRVAGTLGGSGVLTAASTALEGGRIDAELGAGALASRGASTLAGRAAVGNLSVEDGTLTLAAAQRFSAAPTVNIGNGALLAMAGDQNFGALAGQGELALGTFTLATGSGADSSFAGVISGSGGLVKQGASIFTLTGASSYSGITRVDAGTLRIADGGSLSSNRYELTGTLSFARSDNVTLAQEVTGSGNVEQAGSGRLVFSGSNKTYTGQTLVSSGELATANAGALATGSAVVVREAARLVLAGSESVRSVAADGTVSITGRLGASGDLLLRGAVSSAGDIALAGQRIDAANAGNRFGGAVSLAAGDRITLDSGRDAEGARALTLGTVTAANGGRIDSGRLTLADAVAVNGGTLDLVAAAPAGAVAPDAELAAKQIIGLPIAYAADAVVQGDASSINVAAGAGLSVGTPQNGSVQLLRAGNRFDGFLSVVTGTAGTAWAANSATLSFGGAPAIAYAVQSRVRVEGSTVNVGGAGIVADVVDLRADRLATVGEGATIVARLPFDAAVGTATALPALTLRLTPLSFTLAFPFGQTGAEGGLRVDVGSRAYGGRTLPLDAGYVTVLPRNGAQGSTAVLLRGPAVSAGGYRFFFDGAGIQSEIPVFYNGVLPNTPQVENSISATVAVSEAARKNAFDEAVRTENVALRLRAGVIAEVGPAPSATQGTEGIRLPRICPPSTTPSGLLSCPAP
jgi:filamentous hemagglutinin family protein